MSRSPRARLASYALVAATGRAASNSISTAIVLSVLGVGGQASSASALVAGVTITSAVVGPVLGTSLDRNRRPRRVMIAGAWTLAATAAILAVGVGSWPYWVLTLIAVASGVATQVPMGVMSSQLPRLVPEVRRARSFAVDVGAYNAAEVGGPALIGTAVILDSAVPGSIALELVAILYAAFALLLPLLRIPDRAPEDIPQTGTLQTLRTGMTVFADSPVLVGSFVVGVGSMVTLGVLTIAAPLMGLGLSGTAGVGGYLLSMIALGSLGGALVLTRRPVRRGPEGVLAVASLGMVALPLMMAVAPGLPWILAAALVFGVVEAPQVTALFQLRDRESPPSMRAFVFVVGSSTRTLGIAVGTLLAGALADLGWRWLFVVAGLAQLVFLGGGVAARVLLSRHRSGGIPSSL